MKRKILQCITLLGFVWFHDCSAQIHSTLTLPLLPGEQWWGGAVHYGHQMPFNQNSSFSFDLYGDPSNNQSSPLLVSNKGRWVWYDEPFRFSFLNDTLFLVSKNNRNILTGTSGTTLASAYSYTSDHFFHTSGKWPDSLLITAPQYNLWIELQYNPNQKDVLNYAENILKQNWPPGVLMIDDNWTNYYGEFEFDKSKFPDAKKMMDSLHADGFKVMLWICPFITPDSKEFRELQSKKYLLLDSEGDPDKTWQTATKPLLISWWNGYSACLDLTNPGARKWLQNKLDYLQNEYEVDGYKLDAGDPYFYDNKNLLSYQTVTPNDHCTEWAKIGLHYPLNEYRAMWKMGGQPLVQRLADKSHTWSDLQTLIPNTIAQQLMGYTFTCPDMIGGGNFTSFLPGKPLDQNLIVRSAQVHAFMPMMQFSVAPWRILDSAHLKAINNAIKIRQKNMPYIMEVMRSSAITGQPAVKPLIYNYPDKKGYENIKDQFLLGDQMLVAPVLTADNERTVILPPGDWYFRNKKWKGDKSYTISVALDEIPVFIKK